MTLVFSHTRSGILLQQYVHLPCAMTCMRAAAGHLYCKIAFSQNMRHQLDLLSFVIGMGLG